MERLEVADLGKRTFGDLSGGQRQRVLVATAIAGEVRTVLLDEPITGLDLPSQRLILDVVDEERARGRLVMLSTHHLDEAEHCDRVLLLNTSVVADGPPETVLVHGPLAEAFGVHAVRIEGDELEVMDEHGHGTPAAGAGR
jgi:ABC-type Mn2+/Zn2+ transport system ATPase subunit